MQLAHSSRYWKTYRNSKTFTLTIYIHEAHLGVCSYNGSGSFQGGLNNGSVDNSASSSSGVGGAAGHGTGDTKIVVSLPKDPMGERHETSRAGKTPNPVWDQAVVFRDIDYSELVRVEMRGIRKIGDNPVLASVEFEVHDVMGLSLRDGASVFQLECDRSRARYGVIWLAFRFDPPVAADVLGELDGIGSASVPRGVTTTADQGEEERVKAPAWGAKDSFCLPEAGTDVQEPVYINVDGHFACLLLDDDVPVQPCKSGSLRQSSTSSSVSFVEPDSSPGHSRASVGAVGVGHPNHNHHHHLLCQHHHPHTRLSTASQHSSKSEGNMFDSEPLIHGRGSAVRMMAMGGSHASGEGGGGGGMGGGGASGGGGIGGGGSGRRRFAGKDSRTRPASLTNNFSMQLSALGIGGGSGVGSRTNGGKLGRTMGVDFRRKSAGHYPNDDRTSEIGTSMETPQHRWSMPRRWTKTFDTGPANANAPPVVGATAVEVEGDEVNAGFKGSGTMKRARSRGGWAHGLLRSPTLGGLRARASGRASGFAGPARSRSRSRPTAAEPAGDGSGGGKTTASSESASSSCASTVGPSTALSVTEATGPNGDVVSPALAVASARCDIPAALELSPSTFKSPEFSAALASALTSAEE